MSASLRHSRLLPLLFLLLLLLLLCARPCSAAFDYGPPVIWYGLHYGGCKAGAGWRMTADHPISECLNIDPSLLRRVFPSGGVRHVGTQLSDAGGCQVLFSMEFGTVKNATAAWAAGWTLSHVPDENSPPSSQDLWCFPANNCGPAQLRACGPNSNALQYSGQDPTAGCLQYSCGEVSATPELCRCSEEDMSLELHDWYCAEITAPDALARSCRPMQPVQSSMRPGGSCEAGWLECPGARQSPALDPGSLGDRCGCSLYEDEAAPWDTLLCVGLQDIYYEHTWGKTCRLPNPDLSCPLNTYPCRARRTLVLGFNELFLTSLTEMRGHLARAAQVPLNELVFLSVCPSSACPEGVCPQLITSMTQSGCVRAQGLQRLPRRLQNVEVAIEVDVNSQSEAGRGIAVANLLSYVLRQPAPLYPMPPTFAVLSPPPALRTAKAAVEGEKDGGKKGVPWAIIIGSVAAAVALLMVGAAVSRWRGTRGKPENDLQELREGLVHKRCNTPTEMAAINSTPARNSVLENLLRQHNDNVTSRVEHWRSSQVAVPAGRDPVLPLGESQHSTTSTSPCSPWGSYIPSCGDGTMTEDPQGSNSSEIEMAI